MNTAEQVMGELWDLFNKRTWLDGVKMKESLKDYTPSEIHCIDYIGANTDSNVTKMADAFYMTRSAISKLTKKMIEKGLIESYQKPENKKEIYFRLTGKGKAVEEIHKQLHQEYQQRDDAVFKQITKEQYESMLSFIELYSSHLDSEIKKLGFDMRSEGYDRL